MISIPIYRVGDKIKSGNYIYDVFEDVDGILMIKTKYWRWIDLDTFLKIIHDKVEVVERG